MKRNQFLKVLTIQKYSKKKIFHFEEENIEKIKKETLKLDKTAACKKNDAPVSLMKIMIYLQY